MRLRFCLERAPVDLISSVATGTTKVDGRMRNPCALLCILSGSRTEFSVTPDTWTLSYRFTPSRTQTWAILY